ncbi:MAG TPA: DUF1697 domain-containing protein [Bacteroidetes bacterium]|nr:DUF1697 domain-containing protein [Bacteroidota bacterium]
MLPYVAFVRFVTLGRGGQSNDLLRRAYREAGATESATFLATGNVVFETRSEPVAVAARARSLLRDWIGFDQPAHVRPLHVLAAAVDRDPFQGAPSGPVQTRFVTFLPAPSPDLPALPASSPRGDLVVFAADGADVYSVTRLVGGREGSPNAFVERHVGPGLTSRNWNTVERLVATFT